MVLSSQGVSLLVWIAVFTPVTTIIIILRLLAAKIKKRTMRLDDWTIMGAYISTLAMEGTLAWGIFYGLGAHTLDLKKYEIGVQYRSLLGAAVAWLVATVLCKLSILWFYICIFTHKNFKVLVKIVMLFTAGYGISFVCVFLTNCRPISYPWHPTPSGYCTPIVIEETTSASINMVIDTLVVLLPMRPLWGLQLATRKKVAISILFSLGFLVVGLMGWRVKITIDSTTRTDFVYGLGNIALVALLEVWCGIIVACMPTLAPFYSKHLAPLISNLLSFSAQHATGRHLKLAHHTIGSLRTHRVQKRNFDPLDSMILVELEDGQLSRRDEAATTVLSTCEDDTGNRNLETHVIGTKPDGQIYQDPKTY